MQVVKTNIGTFIDSLPFKKYGKEVPGYDWRQHIGDLPVNNFEISKSVADYISSYGDVDVSSFKRVSLG